MEAILKFDLDDTQDVMAHERCIKAIDMAIILFELTYNVKKQVQSELDYGKSDKNALELIYEHLYELLATHDINIDKLIS